MTPLPRSPGSTLVLRLNQETVHDFILPFMPPCGPHLTPLAIGSLERSLLVFSAPRGLTSNDIRACSSPAPTPVKPQPAPAILSQESVHTTLSITHHTRKRPSTGPRTTHGPHTCENCAPLGGPLCAAPTAAAGHAMGVGASSAHPVAAAAPPPVGTAPFLAGGVPFFCGLGMPPEDAPRAATAVLRSTTPVDDVYSSTAALYGTATTTTFPEPSGGGGCHSGCHQRRVHHQRAPPTAGGVPWPFFSVP
jgi:hypothetical protein